MSRIPSSTLERQSASMVWKPDQTDSECPILTMLFNEWFFTTRRLLSSVQKDVLPASHVGKIIYEFQCRWHARYVGRTSLRLKDCIEKHVPLGIRRDQSSEQRQPTQACQNVHSTTTIPCKFKIGHNLLNNPQCAEQYRIGWFKILSIGHSLAHLHAMEATFIRATNPILWRQKKIVRTLYLFRL